LHFLLQSFLATKCNRIAQATVSLATNSFTWSRTALNAPTTQIEQLAADPDLQAVARVLAGEVEAFELIVRRWQTPLINMAWRYCRDRHRAEELAQEAFVRAWRGLASWRQESAFSTWLFALAANVFRSDLKRFPAVSVPFEEAAEPSTAARQHDILSEAQLCESVRSAVLALPQRYREPVVLFYFQEMDVDQTARIMKLPPGTVKARLSRARDLLRQRFPQLGRTLAAHPSGLLATQKELQP
jgi:RNA polymerase sigma-70 factor (ECF subfamily)